MTRVYLKRFLLIVLASSSLSACADDITWQGTYNYEATLGQNVAGDAVVIDHMLSIKESSCALKIEGYQISEEITCDAQQEKDTLTVRFTSYSDGSTRNIYDVAVYKVGGTLFSLSHDNKQLITSWGELIPDESLPKTGIYFIKQQH